MLNAGDGLADWIDVERVGVLPGHIATGFFDWLAHPTILMHALGTRDDLTVPGARCGAIAHAHRPRLPRCHVRVDEPSNLARAGAGAMRNVIVILVNALRGRHTPRRTCTVQFHRDSVPWLYKRALISSVLLLAPGILANAQ